MLIHTILISFSLNSGNLLQYECRKSLAEKRPRVQGRFAKNEEEIHENTYHTVIRKREIHHEEVRTYVCFSLCGLYERFSSSVH